MGNNQLPDEVRERIKTDAAKSTNKRNESLRYQSKDYGRRISFIDGYEQGYVAGATTEFIKLQEVQQEVTRLTNWQQEAKAILNPIWDYADTLKVPLGESKTDAVIKHVKDAKDLLTEVFQKHESGLLPDRFIYEKIKRFLYGE